MRLVPAVSFVLLSACAAAPDAAPMDASPDLHSFAEPQRVRSRHLELHLTLDFDAKVARGCVVHHIERADATAPFVLDTDGLDVRSACDQNGKPLAFDLASLPDPIRGRRLAVRLRPDTSTVRIDYATAPDAEAMQWLAPEQTDGGKAPFLFTQGQAILTRSAPAERALRRLGRAVDARPRRQRARRHRDDGHLVRVAVRPVPLGPLRRAGAAAELPVRRHGEPVPDVWWPTNWRTAGRATW